MSKDSSMRPLRARVRTSTRWSGPRRSSSLSSVVNRCWVTSRSCARRTSLSGRGPSSSVASSWARQRMPRRDVAPVNPQLAPIAVDAADDDVRVRVARVEVVDRRPLHFAPDVPLERRHQAPHVGGEVELRAVLRRDDETKLVLLAGTRLLEDPRANRPCAS